MTKHILTRAMRQNKRSIATGKDIARPALLNQSVPASGLKAERSNLTKLLLSVGKVFVNCENCSLGFLKPAAWAKRVARHFCSRSCANAGKITRLRSVCTICKVDLLITPSYMRRGLGKTGSHECLVKLKSIEDHKRKRDSDGRCYAPPVVEA